MTAPQRTETRLATQTGFSGITKCVLPLFLIVLLGLSLRLWGVNHGLPYVYDPDEPFYTVLAGGMLGNMDPNPHWFGHPGTPYLYLLALVDILIFLGGILLGVFKSPADFRLYYHSDPSLIYLGGRLVSLVFAVATIYLLYRVARKFLPEIPSLLAALLLAVSPLHIEFSKLIRSDTMMAFLVLLSFNFCLSILQEGSPKSYWWAGFFAGLGVATKYPAALVIPVIVLAHFLRHGFGTKNFRFLFLAAGAAIVGFIIGTPFFLFELKSAISALIFEGSHENLWADSLAFPAQVWF